MQMSFDFPDSDSRVERMEKVAAGRHASPEGALEYLRGLASFGSPEQDLIVCVGNLDPIMARHIEHLSDTYQILVTDRQPNHVKISKRMLLRDVRN